MIDISNETVISPADAVKNLPRRRGGKRPNISTVYRWMVDGVRGIKLESICIGGTRCTSIEALQRFFDRLTAKADGQPVEKPQKLTAKRRKQIEAAEKRLEKAGV